MEMQELPKAVLVLVMVSLILAVGLLVLNKVDRASRDTTTVITTGYNMTTAGTKDFAQTYCIDIKSVANASTSFDLTTYNVVWTSEDDCAMSYDLITGCGPTIAQYCNITYTYGADNTQAGATLVNVVSALSPIASSWMALIITVVVLAIILVLVLNSFGASRQ